VKGKDFFFEKKKQKTFVNWHRDRVTREAISKSLFASFSSEKEESSFSYRESAP
jgi:hypothetical protein